MNKLRPILQGSPSKMERLLLSSAQLDRPPRNAKKRALAVLGIGGSVIATTQVAGVATATAATPVAGVAAAAAATTGTGAVAAAGATTGFALAALKGLAIGLVTATAAYGSLTVYREHKQTALATARDTALQTMTPERNRIDYANGIDRASAELPAVAQLSETGSLPATGTLPPADSATPPAVAQAQQPVTAARPLPKLARADLERTRQVPRMPADRGEAEPPIRVAAATPAAILSHKPPPFPEERLSLRSERATIELAQSLVRGGEPAAALRTLSEHRRRYPKPQLGPEAMLVRIEALLKLGQLSDAQRLGLQVLASQPDGPYAQRVRSLLKLPTTP